MEVIDRRNVLDWGNAHLNLQRRVWMPRSGHWEPGKPQAFTTVLLPHDPVADPAVLAATIAVLRDTPEATLLQVKDGDTVRTIVLNTAGKPVTVETLTTDAEAALLTAVHGKPTHLSAWHATQATLDGKKLLSSSKAKDLDCKVK